MHRPCRELSCSARSLVLRPDVSRSHAYLRPLPDTRGPRRTDHCRADSTSQRDVGRERRIGPSGTERLRGLGAHSGPAATYLLPPSRRGKACLCGPRKQTAHQQPPPDAAPGGRPRSCGLGSVHRDAARSRRVLARARRRALHQRAAPCRCRPEQARGWPSHHSKPGSRTEVPMSGGAAMTGILQPLAIRTGAIFDGERAWGPGMVLIQGGLITGIDTSGAPAPADSLFHDFGDGVTVMPGLIDCHVHLSLDASPQAMANVATADDDALVQHMVVAATTALRAGITTVRDLGDRRFLSLRLRDHLARNGIPAPRIVAAGPPLTTHGGHLAVMGGEADGP